VRPAVWLHYCHTRYALCKGRAGGQLPARCARSCALGARAQALLETSSLAARLKLLLSALIASRNRLQLLVALQSVDGEASQ